MEESYETFEEELWPPRADAPPQRPVRQIHRASGEIYSSRKIKEELSAVPPQPRSEPKTLQREPSFTKPTSLRKTLSIQNLTQIEKPWENVTLNRCLFVAISILVLSSGFHKLHETLRGQETTEEEEGGLIWRRSDLLRHRRHLSEAETTLWEVLFWWLPDLDDEEIKRRESKREVKRPSRGLRNKMLPEKKLLKQRDGKLKDRRAKKIKEKRRRAKKEEHEDTAD